MKTKTLLAALSLALSNALWADTEATIIGNELEIAGLDAAQKYQLRIQLPNKQLKTLNLQSAGALRFTAADFAMSDFSDGIYKYELVPMTGNLKRIRGSDVGLTKEIAKAEKISGSFTVKNGQTVTDQDETGSTRDQYIADDLVVDGSACIGMDCVNGENFGFDTIRLKENNLRIKFDDTSNSGSFPSNDWELTANDSANGGLSFFGITDSTAGKRPFTVEAGANNNSLYIENDGDIGFGTSNPVVKNHLADGDTPTVRLEQDGSFGWTPQIWDVAGNEANFFVRDASNGSTLPFRIRPGAPTSSIDIASSGNVGIGTSSPDESLSVVGTSGDTLVQVTENSSTQGGRTLFKISNNGNAEIAIENRANNNTWVISGGAKLTIKNDLGEKVFEIDQDGNLSVKGTITQNAPF